MGGQHPQVYDDPDMRRRRPLRWGALREPMTINGAPQSYMCQFEYDITTFV